MASLVGVNWNQQCRFFSMPVIWWCFCFGRGSMPVSPKKIVGRGGAGSRLVNDSELIRESTQNQTVFR